jgi:hypothetical protein
MWPLDSLVEDRDGNLFGLTLIGGAFNHGRVFEIANTASGYAAAPTILASFDIANGALPVAGLIVDANGNLFGTTVGLPLPLSGFRIPGPLSSVRCVRSLAAALYYRRFRKYLVQSVAPEHTTRGSRINTFAYPSAICLINKALFKRLP